MENGDVWNVLNTNFCEVLKILCFAFGTCVSGELLPGCQKDRGGAKVAGPRPRRPPPGRVGCLSRPRVSLPNRMRNVHAPRCRWAVSQNTFNASRSSHQNETKGLFTRPPSQPTTKVAEEEPVCQQRWQLTELADGEPLGVPDLH